MKSLLQRALEKGLSDELKDIPLAQILWKFVDTDSLSDVNRLLTAIKSNKGVDVNINEDEQDVNTDVRLRRILLRGIRKYPAESNTYYSIDFSCLGQCRSSVFLGANGIGKSSLYSAIEYGLLRDLVSARARGYEKPSDQKEYLRNVHNVVSESVIGLETHHQNIAVKLKEEVAGDGALSFPAFFCMNYDIEELSRGMKSEFIARQLGLVDFHALLIWMDGISEEVENYEDDINELTIQKRKIEFGHELNKALLGINDDGHKAILLKWESVYLKDTKEEVDDNTASEYKKLKKVLGIIQGALSGYISMEPLGDIFGLKIESILTGSEDIATPLLKSQVLRLREVVKFLDQRIRGAFVENSDSSIISLKSKDENLRELEDFYKNSEDKLKTKVRLYGVPKSNLDNFDKVRAYLNNEYYLNIKELLTEARIVFNDMFSNYFWDDISSVSLDIDGSMRNLEVRLRIVNPITGTKSMAVNPRRFLNTFRFKLYCVTLKISLAFCCMRLYGVNSPIVIDDVFDSSDFANREQIRKFIRTLFETHERIFHSVKPLQLIFFTQDDVIGDSVYRGISDFQPGEGVKYSRIFDLHEVDEKDEVDELIPFLGIEGKPETYKFKVIRVEDHIK